MILIELDSGSQRIFRSPAELAGAIRRGELGPSSRIYHRASAQWLPITEYPEFRKSVAERARAALPPLARRRWTFFGMEPAQGADLAGAGAAPATSAPGKDSPATAGESKGQSAAALRRTLGRAIKYIRSMG